LSAKGAERFVLEDGEALLEAAQAAPEVSFSLGRVFAQLVPTHHHQDDVQFVEDDA